jgi:hypothetical protein
MATRAAARKCHGQRISHTELIAESQQRVRECGVPNNQRAHCLAMLAGHAVGSENPILCQQQPKQPKSKMSLAWRKAYGLVLSFLDEKSLRFTLDTFAIERPEASELAIFGRTLSELVQTGIEGTESRGQERLQLIRTSGSSASDVEKPE